MAEIDPNQEAESTFSAPADVTGNSQLWLPVLAALLLFLIVAAAFMLFSSLSYDARSPETTGRETPPANRPADSPSAQP